MALPLDLPDLPVGEVLDEVRDALRDPGRAVLVAPPGAGKTTIVPLALLEEPWLGDRRILVLEPRRLAARAAARRMSDLLGSPLGGTVGFQTRDERRIGPDTRIAVLTEGVLTRRIQGDPSLEGIGAVLFDEVHERHLTTDLGLAFTVEVADAVRPDLRLLAMSATVDPAPFSRVLGGAPVITSDGRSHPVELRWTPRRPKERLEPAVAEVVRRALRDEAGDVLVFLPGIGEILRTRDLLVERLGPDVDVLPLAGALALADQDRALAPAPAGRRRVVLATDIAETSLTVEGVRVVVDSGLARAPRFDPRTGMTRLTTVAISRDSADQRAGRAGRTEPGACYRLWSAVEHGTRQAHRTPEITAVDLAGTALELAAWGTDPAELALLDPPPARTLAAGRELLRELGALDADDRPTDLGRQMLVLPVHPRLAAMIVAEPTPTACLVAALLDERDIVRVSHGDVPADLALRAGLVMGATHDDRADRRALARVRDRAADIARRAGIRFDLDDVEPDRCGAVLLHAYPDRVAARRRPGQFQLRTGQGAWVPVGDPLADAPFIVAADLDGKRDRARVRPGAALEPDDVRALLRDVVEGTPRLEWDPDRDDLVERVEQRLGSIRLGEVVRRPAPGVTTERALLDRARTTGLAVLGWSDAAVRLRERVDHLHRRLGDPWPDWSIDHLVATVDEWLAPFVAGATGRDDLERLDMAVVLRSMLPWPEGAGLDALAPAELELPTGRSVPISYRDDQPSASVRVQDLFGVTAHPTAAGQPIVLHLLSPADRPLQVTADLPGFWTGSWAEVRKEMAGRYPKHSWPVDPAASPPRRLKDR